MKGCIYCLQNADFVPHLLEGLLLLGDQEPRAQDGRTDFESVKARVQRDYAECLQQLALFEPGREALRKEPAVAEALRTVARDGFSEDARHCARFALTTLSLEEGGGVTPAKMPAARAGMFFVYDLALELNAG
eukprot:SAG31_NODE_4619_length_3091_cov_2.016711_2_plen_133_part_00